MHKNIKKLNFGAKVAVRTEEMHDFMDYLQRNVNSKQGWYNSKKDLNLIYQIFDAFEKHPSKEVIIPDVAYFKNCLFGARGTVKTSRAAFIDTEPARADSIAPVLNIFRRILDPQNKSSFNRLLGEEYAHRYDAWWQEQIAPIWDDVQERFRENTFFENRYDDEFNRDFNRESGKEKDFFNQRGNFWIKLYNK